MSLKFGEALNREDRKKEESDRIPPDAIKQYLDGTPQSVDSFYNSKNNRLGVDMSKTLGYIAEKYRGHVVVLRVTDKPLEYEVVDSVSWVGKNTTNCIKEMIINDDEGLIYVIPSRGVTGDSVGDLVRHYWNLGYNIKAVCVGYNPNNVSMDVEGFDLFECSYELDDCIHLHSHNIRTGEIQRKVEVTNPEYNSYYVAHPNMSDRPGVFTYVVYNKKIYNVIAHTDKNSCIIDFFSDTMRLLFTDIMEDWEYSAKIEGKFDNCTYGAEADVEIEILALQTYAFRRLFDIGGTMPL